MQDLELEIKRACIKASGEIPHDVITVCSSVAEESGTPGNKLHIRWVYPADDDLAEGKISVFAPVGTAIRGYRGRDILVEVIPDGMVRLEVEKVLYQPEANGPRYLIIRLNSSANVM